MGAEPVSERLRPWERGPPGLWRSFYQCAPVRRQAVSGLRGGRGGRAPSAVPRGRVLTGPARPQVQQLERSIGLKDLAVADLEQKVQELQASTFDGVFIWKISDFARKRQEAVAGRAPAIFSPGAPWGAPPPRPRAAAGPGPLVRRAAICSPSTLARGWVGPGPPRAPARLTGACPAAFYTSRYGYKMCLRAYLNGDGTGRGTHLSLFFVLMKGPNDALLRWPFNQKVRGRPGAPGVRASRGGVPGSIP